MDNIFSSFGGIPSLKNNAGNEASDAEAAKEMKMVHNELALAMSSPADGGYYIRSVTKDRYLDVAYEKKEDNAQIIGQTLNGSPSANQRVRDYFIRVLIIDSHIRNTVDSQEDKQTRLQLASR